MRQFILSLGLIWSGAAALAFEVEDRVVFGTETATQLLSVISTADVDVFLPLIEAFRAETPGVTVDYTVASSTEIDRAVGVEAMAFDVVISSAMDLQTRLVNDGFAAPYTSQTTQLLPEWAQWRSTLFAFTQEPAAIVLSRAAFSDGQVPQTRQELISVLRQNPDRFRGRVGTYDLEASGLGYLFATQDSRTSEIYWPLTEVMGALDAQLYCCSADMIDDVASGDLAFAYNVLGSYALSRPDQSAFHILYPADFTTVMMRTVFISQSAPNPDLAGTFVDFLLRQALERPEDGPNLAGLGGAVPGPLAERMRRIRLGPELLVYLDRFKKTRFLEAWQDAVLQR